MHDDDLRAGFNTMLGAIREAPPPPLPLIRRRLRRRRTRAIAVSTAALAGIAAAALSIHLTAMTPTEPAAPPSGPHIPGQQHSTRTFRVLSSVRSLALSAAASQVTISGSRHRAISVTERIRYARTPPAFSRSVTGRTLRLGYACPAERVCSVSYHIQIPRRTAVSVTLQTGSIMLSGLAGPVTARTGTGAISAAKLSGDTVRLSTGTGVITAGFAAPPASLQATTKHGAINIGVPGTVLYNVVARAVTYVINVNISASVPYAITAQAGVGDITVVPGAPVTSLSAAMRGGINDYCSGAPCARGSSSGSGQGP